MKRDETLLLLRNQKAELIWRLIIATRNRLIYAYLGIDRDTHFFSPIESFPFPNFSVTSSMVA